MLEITIIFLGVSLLFYVLFGGADFGAGIIEIFIRKKYAPLITSAIGPVWEANHMWLVLMVVILFMGFPAIYTTVSIHLHIPLLLMLIGIIFRGTAFTFRHYDAVRDNSEKVYSLIFRYSSLFTSFFLGVTLGGIILGRIDLAASTFFGAYLNPWLNWFSFTMGIFTCCLFAFLAAIYMIGEARNRQERNAFIIQAVKANLVTVISGILVFVSGKVEGLPLFNLFLHSPFSIICMVLATISIPLLWLALKRRSALYARLIAGFQTLLILIGWFAIQYPVIVNLTTGEDLTFQNTAAPEATLYQLGLALIVGSVFILPSLFYLFRVFKFKKSPG